MEFTSEQQEAIRRREGDLLLDAGAGSGKTTVLVERFARSVLEDGLAPTSLLTITFTEKAAAELRARIRARLRLGAGGSGGVSESVLRAVEAAPISTIHGFCARLLRAGAVAAELDPRFTVLDRAEAERLADGALHRALTTLSEHGDGQRLISTYGVEALRGLTLGAHAELRSRGVREPRLPSVPLPPPDLDALRGTLRSAAAALQGELGAIRDPGARVTAALETLERCEPLLEDPEVWPGALVRLRIQRGAAALTTDTCAHYVESLEAFRRGCAHRRGIRDHAALDDLLQSFGTEYAEAKRAEAALDFADLELVARDLLAGSPELRERLRNRYARVMVDEFQDTNHVQLELISQVTRENLFTVGDAQQSIYGFRHADVGLFLSRGRRLAARGARLTLQTNFRSRKELLNVIDRAFAAELGEAFMPLRAGRDVEATSTPGGSEADPLVELLVADKAGRWEQDDFTAAPWRLAEAAALAERIGEMVDGGTRPGEIVVLTRATTDMRVYERALEDRGVPTYVVGGRGYWGHPQVVDLIAYLRALANPLDELALLGALSSPLAGVSLDGLVLVASEADRAATDVWSVLRTGAPIEGLSPADDGTLAAFRRWFAEERMAIPRTGTDELIERALLRSGYDAAMLRMQGGRRRLANVRKLGRLAREHEADTGPDLRGFLRVVRGREGTWTGDATESEAPVEGESLNAVRLMTVHRSKGLEFPVTCVADLGRAPWRGQELLRLGGDGRIGLKLAELGWHGREPAFAYDELGEEALAAEAAEERRLFYVACTRAQERLILSGAVKLENWKAAGCPMAWLAPALLGDDFAACLEAREGTSAGVRYRFFGQPPSRPAEAEVSGVSGMSGASGASAGGGVSGASGASGASAGGGVRGVSGVRTTAGAGAAPAAAVGAAVGDFCTESVQKSPPKAAVSLGPGRPLSYSALADYGRCGYRYYAERILRLPPAIREAGAIRDARAGSGLSAAERGTVVHALLERLDFRRPVVPDAVAVASMLPVRPAPGEAERIAELIGRFASSEVCQRLAAVRDVRREVRFAFPLGDGSLMTGVLDVLARESPQRLLIVDYKTDRLSEAPAALVSARYETQQLVYGLAGLHAGAAEVDVLHVFLDSPEEVVAARYAAEQRPALLVQLEALARPMLLGRFEVTSAPCRNVCSGCPAEDGLCSYPASMTRRDAPDRLF